MKVEIEGLEEFITAIDKATDGELAEQMGQWLEAMGMNFLDIIQDEIINSRTVDTRRLLNSFGKGDSDNIWKISEGGLTLEVGTNVDYASYANDGHMLNPQGVDTRWVPGRWVRAGQDERFEYDPSADTGMFLKQKWVEGSRYWDKALAIFESNFDKNLDRLLQKWLDSMFQ